MTSVSSVLSVALTGLDGQLVEVEAAVAAGLPRTVLIGLPDAALYQARDRCKAACAAAGLGWPQHLLTINLTPATLPKAGSHYDLAIAAAVLLAEEKGDPARLTGAVVLGELGLDGRIRGVRGLLAALLAARRAGLDSAVVPAAQVGEARLVDGLTLVPMGWLHELAAWLDHRDPPDGLPDPDPETQPAARPNRPSVDLADVAGQVEARWALEVAAAGRHHLLLHGPPGVGKTLLAERLPTILPELTVPEALEVSAIHSLAGYGLGDRLDTRPPYADPHHTASVASIIGGGARLARPGAVSCAHRGVLFLDEAPEFPARVLDSLRTPLEQGAITLARAEAQVRYPARFQLVLAANPCPCGNAGVAGAECACPPISIRRYAERISGPIRDRIDLQQALVPLRSSYLRAAEASRESSAAVAERVSAARDRQRRRLAGTPWTTNGELPGGHLRRRLPVPDGLDEVERAVQRGTLSARGVDRVIRISWTLADLAGLDRPGRDQVEAALVMRRGGERGSGWGSAA